MRKGGENMGLQKRNCGISITLTPCGCYVLDVDFDFYGTKISFSPSSAMGDQFGAFLSALYTLYSEGSDGHSEWCMREYPGKHRLLHTDVMLTTAVILSVFVRCSVSLKVLSTSSV